MYRPEILENRVYLITVISMVTTIAALSPFFLGTVFSFELLIHDLIHITAISLGIFLTILSSYAYFTTKNKSLVFTTLAFLTFVLLSIYMLEQDMEHAQVSNEHCDMINYPCIEVEQSQILVETALTVMIGFFAVGVFWNSKKRTSFRSPSSPSSS